MPFVCASTFPFFCLVLSLPKEDDKEVTDAHGRAGHVEKRSINMALSYRGQVALRLVGIEEKVLSESVPMPKRVIHKRDGFVDVVEGSICHLYLSCACVCV